MIIILSGQKSHFWGKEILIAQTNLLQLIKELCVNNHFIVICDNLLVLILFLFSINNVIEYIFIINYDIWHLWVFKIVQLLTDFCVVDFWVQKFPKLFCVEQIWVFLEKFEEFLEFDDSSLEEKFVVGFY